MATAVADSYTAASGEAIYAGLVAPPPSVRALLVGDSLTSLSYGPRHPYTWTLGLNGGVLKPVANIAIAGNTVADVLARIDNDYTNATPGAAGLGTLGWFLLRVGTNDTRGGTSINSTIQTAYDDLITALLGYCSRGIVFAVPPISSPESGAGVGSFNAWLSSYCAGNSRLFFCDDCTTVNNGSGAWASGYVPGDGIHTTDAGSYRMGVDGAAALESHLASFAYASPLSTDAADVYPAQPQWIANHVMAGTGGSNSLSGGGSVANSWSVGPGGGSIDGTCAKVAADGGDTNQTPWQRISPTQIADNGTDGGIGASIALTGRTITDSDPDSLDVILEVRMNALATQRFRYLRVFAYGNSNEELSPPMFLRLGAGPTTETAVMRCAIRRSATRVAHASAQLNILLCSSESFTGSMGSVDFRCATVRG